MTVDDSELLLLSSPGPCYKWEPEPDITAYELARCLPILIGNHPDQVDKLPDEMRRHFTEITDGF